MFGITLFCLIVFPIILFGANYKQIWEENYLKTFDWKRPVRNYEFLNSNTEKCEDFGEFHFVIVGAGSSGSVMANRLSENRDWNILLIDAGGNESEFSQMPGAFMSILNTKMNWGYLTVPQDNACFGSVNNQCDMSAGKVLGGGSSISAMIYGRGSPKDYDAWGKMGNVGWSYSDLLKYFDKAEKEMNISEFKDLPEINRIVGAKDGVQVFSKNGKRYSTNQGYLEKAARRNNLKIITNSLVIKINFDEPHDAATDILFLNKEGCKKVKILKELILSAGAINTPQLLLLSGVGPKEDLEQLNIKVVNELPVGQNLIDHVAVFIIPIYTNLTIERKSFIKILEDYSKGFSEMTQPAAIASKYKTVNNVPVTETLYKMPNNFISPELVVKQGNYKDFIQQTLLRFELNTIMQHIILLNPKSKGYVKLKSADPLDFPLINPNYLEDINDVQILYKTIQENLNNLKEKSYMEVNAHLGNINLPKCAGLKDEDYWVCLIRHMSNAMYHPIGTCRMGNNVNHSVVDYNLLIHAFKNVRIVDASVLPGSISGHTAITAIVVAEKIADYIKANSS